MDRARSDGIAVYLISTRDAFAAIRMAPDCHDRLVPHAIMLATLACCRASHDPRSSSQATDNTSQLYGKTLLAPDGVFLYLGVASYDRGLPARKLVPSKSSGMGGRCRCGSQRAASADLSFLLIY